MLNIFISVAINKYWIKKVSIFDLIGNLICNQSKLGHNLVSLKKIYTLFKIAKITIEVKIKKKLCWEKFAMKY